MSLQRETGTGTITGITNSMTIVRHLRTKHPSLCGERCLDDLACCSMLQIQTCPVKHLLHKVGPQTKGCCFHTLVGIYTKAAMGQCASAGGPSLKTSVDTELLVHGMIVRNSVNLYRSPKFQ